MQGYTCGCRLGWMLCSYSLSCQVWQATESLLVLCDVLAPIHALHFPSASSVPSWRGSSWLRDGSVLAWLWGSGCVGSRAWLQLVRTASACTPTS